jgi:hypothetical protein
MAAAAPVSPSVPIAEEQTKAMIRTVVLGTLKQRNCGERIQVHLLWDNHYRVNVVIGDAALSVTISKSYFLIVDGAGKIVASSPALVAA